MKRHMLWIVASLLILHLSSCDVREILPNDLSDPAHARYVASGEKARDRREGRAFSHGSRYELCGWLGWFR